MTDGKQDTTTELLSRKEQVRKWKEDAAKRKEEGITLKELAVYDETTEATPQSGELVVYTTEPEKSVESQQPNPEPTTAPSTGKLILVAAIVLTLLILWIKERRGKARQA